MRKQFSINFGSNSAFCTVFAEIYIGSEPCPYYSEQTFFFFSTTCVFWRLARVVCFPALGTSCTVSRAPFQWVKMFPALSPALSTGYLFSYAWYRMYAASRPRLARVACFLSFAPVNCFPARGTSAFFTGLTSVTGFPAPGTSWQLYGFFSGS